MHPQRLRAIPWLRRLAAIGLPLATILLALPRLGQSLWSDEATSVWLARLPLSTLVTALCDPHPPGYYLALKLWLLGGEAEAWLRLPSLLAAALAVVFTYGLGRDMGGRRCAWIAAALLALHPLHIWYAGEVRMYAGVTALGVLMVWLGWRLLERGMASDTGDRLWGGCRRRVRPRLHGAAAFWHIAVAMAGARRSAATALAGPAGCCVARGGGAVVAPFAIHSAG